MRIVKIITLIALFLLIDFKIITSSPLPSQCSIDTIKLAIPVLIFAEQTIDGPNQPIFLTRFLHNKVGIFLSEFSKCYFSILDPNYIKDRVGTLGLFLNLAILYYLIISKKLKFITLYLLIPLLSIFKIPNFSQVTILLFWTFAASGAIILIKSR